MKKLLQWNGPTNPHLPVVLFVPVAVVQVLWALARWPGHWAQLLADMAVGLLCWSALEYFFHRVLFHVPVGKKPWDIISRNFHWQHHVEPRNPDLVALTPLFTIPLYLFLTWRVWVWGGPVWALGWGAGLALGYTAYERVHYVVHFNPTHGPVMGYLRRHHAKHHFQDHTKRFGVSSPLWDWIFRSA